MNTAAAAVLRRPALLFLLVASLMAIAVWPIGRLQFDADVSKVFLSNSPLSLAQSRFEDQAPEDATDVVLLIESERALTEDQLTAARGFIYKLTDRPYVTSVLSSFDVRLPPTSSGQPGPRLLPDPPTDRITADRLDEFQAAATGLPTFLTRDALLILVSLDTGQTPLAEAVFALNGDGRGLADSGLTMTVTGEDVIALEIREGLGQDLVRLNLIGAAIVAVASVLLLRGVRLAVIAIVPGLLGAVATLGLAAWLCYPVTILSNVIPMLMLVIGVANAMHLAVHLSRTDGDIQTRVRKSLREVAPASVLTTLTTGIAFASIMLTRNDQLFEFAILGMAGVGVTLILLIPTFAALALLLAPPRIDVGRLASRFSVRLGEGAMRRARVVSVVGLVSLVAVGAGFATTKAWFPLSDNLPLGSTLIAANDKIADRFGGVFRAWVEMPDGSDWADLASAVEAVEALVPNGTVMSELALARWVGTPDSPPPDALLTRLPSTVTERLRDPSDGTLRFAVNMQDPMQSEDSLARFDAVRMAALQAGAERVLGLPAIIREGVEVLIRQLSWGLLTASLAGAAAVAAALRSARLFPMVLVLNLLPVLTVGAVVHLTSGGHLTPPFALALTIAFGIALDDTIHFLGRRRSAIKRGLSRPDATRAALHEAGGVMTMTTLILCLGLSVTMFSAFEPVRQFGGALSLSLAAALLTDLVLLPALLGLREDTENRNVLPL